MVKSREANISVDRLDEVIKMGPACDVRAVKRVLVEEDFGDGVYPIHRDIQRVADIVRIGAPALSIRFREVDPAIWSWLVEQLTEEVAVQ